MRILILGVSGLIGHKLFQELSSDLEVFGTLHKSKKYYGNLELFSSHNIIENVNVAEFEILKGILRATNPDVIINCVGITKRKDEINDPFTALTINSVFPHQLANWAKDNGKKILHFSTDCVFDGKVGNYNESSLTTAEDIYGRTKALGDIRYSHTLTIRSSFIGQELFGKTELLEWFLSQKGKKVQGYRNTFYSGVSTMYMARVVRDIILNYSNLSGLYHLAPEKPISKYDLICIAKEAYNINVDIIPEDDHVHFPTLDGSKLRSEINLKIPSWQDMMFELSSDKDFLPESQINQINYLKKEKYQVMKIMTIVGTRPEIIKMSRVMAELSKYVDHVLVHTGQNYDYELNEIFFENLGVKKPDYFLEVAGKNVAYTIGNVISKSDDVFDLEKPDALLLYGDTNSCLAVISAKRRKIPVFHFEAGNRCFDQRVPEELNRKVLDHLSDINFPLTEHARRYLLAEGIKPDTIIKPGSPMKEILDFHSRSINASDVLERLNLKKNQFFIVSSHREENVDSEENFNDLLDSLNAISEKFKYPVIVSTHPRTKIKLESLNRKDLNPLIQFLKPMGFFDYNKMQQNAYCVISDSGTISEESSILNFPAITIRQAHERPEGMDEGTLIMSGLQKERILQSIGIVVSQFSKEKRVTKIVPDYDVDNFSIKVVRVIISYIDYVNRTVWRK